MERTVRTQRTLSKQEGIDEDTELNNYESTKSSPEQSNNNNNNNNKGQLQGQMSAEDAPHQQAQPPAQNGNLHRSRSQNKVKLLVRSHAVREETSPPPEPTQEQPKQESRRHKDWQPPLSRGNSREQQYDGGNQVDLHQFIVETLNRNHKDRMLLLKIENELVNLANDPKRTMHKFAQMSSYQRMLVHRVAAYFSMEHNVDTSGVAVIVNTTKSTRLPETRFRDFVRDDLLLPEEPRRSILKRDSSSFDETGSYKVDGDIDCIDDFQWESDENGVFSNDCDQSNHNQRNGRLLKVESYESGDTLRANSLRLSVSKSHSFNGYEAPQQPPHHPPSTRVLTKQDSGSSMSSRISPSSSGYKSQRSDATLSATPSPTATPNLHTQSGQPYTNPDGSIYHYDPNNPPRMIADNNAGAQVTNAPQGSQSPAKHGEWKKRGRGGKGTNNRRRNNSLMRSGGIINNDINGVIINTPNNNGNVTNFNNVFNEGSECVPDYSGTAIIIPQVYYDPLFIPATTYVEPPPQIPMEALVYTFENSGTTYFYTSPNHPPPVAEPVDYYNWPPLELYKDDIASTIPLPESQMFDRLY
ncbi:unnamed protein product [Nezara viridula]|uniref:R3H domain-containing protein n=1 Tax=Nezara viridula TaxID=85310 RepID=A0A9P0HJK4_NEZVI|nr:unnamed protein product [Nezara viridula]